MRLIPARLILTVRDEKFLEVMAVEAFEPILNEVVPNLEIDANASKYSTHLSALYNKKLGTNNYTQVFI